MSDLPTNVPKPYLTVIPQRRQETKMHNGLGQAKNAVGASSYSYERFEEVIDGIHTGRTRAVGRVLGGKIYQWVKDEWKLIYDIPYNSLENVLPWRADKFDGWTAPGVDSEYEAVD